MVQAKGKWRALPLGRATRTLWALGLCLVTAFGRPARVAAQEAFVFEGGPAPAPPAPGGTEQAVVARYWNLGRVRWFAATTLEAGYAYVRPRFDFGYGQPYWKWVGVETYPLVALSGLGYYGGIHAVVPGLTLRVGSRYVLPFRRGLLPPQERYRRSDLDLDSGPRADYWAFEAEAVVTVPVSIGSAFMVLSGTRTQGVEEGYYLWEEGLRAIIDPPYIARARLGYLFSFGQNGAIRLGPAAEVLALPGRGEFIVRGGLLTSVLINAHLEAQFSLIPPIVSSDSIGLAGGDFGQLGVRFRWATDSTPEPERVKDDRQRGRPLLEAPQ